MDRAIESHNDPIVAIYNNLETFYPFLSRIDDPSILEPRKYRGDRALFWLGSDKLVFTSSQIPTAQTICQRYGYNQTHSISPEKTTFQLSLDIQNDPQMMAQIVQYAGPGKAIQIVPYATTRELYRLADSLRTQCGLTVSLPESPAEEDFWARDYFDTKLGFRRDAPNWITDSVRLPHGFAVQDLDAAAEAISWFLDRGLDCIMKPDRGESGLGIQFFDHRIAHPDLKSELCSNAYCKGDHILVEEYILPKTGLSPSLELFVPALGGGEPYITYLSNQHFGSLGRFSGVIISKTYLETGWYSPLAENGLRIANQLQKLGYVGNFDVDTVVDRQNRVYLLEINTRRTGGTHAHEFGCFTFGPNYLEEVALFSTNYVICPGVTALDQLFDRLSPVLFPICAQKRGVVITVTSTLHAGDFGCFIIGEGIADLMAIKRKMERLLRPVEQSQAVLVNPGVSTAS